MTKPKIGDVWRYPYLWSREANLENTEGRKPRPTLLSAVVPVSDQSTLLYLLAITGTVPLHDQDALEIPTTEIRRAGLSEYKRLWIIFDEYNRDTLESSFYFEPNANVGAFSRAFVKVVAQRFARAIRQKNARLINRSE